MHGFNRRTRISVHKESKLLTHQLPGYQMIKAGGVSSSMGWQRTVFRYYKRVTDQLWKFQILPNLSNMGSCFIFPESKLYMMTAAEKTGLVTAEAPWPIDQMTLATANSLYRTD